MTAAGVALLVAASGKVDIKTTVLLTPEEVDAAAKVGGDYRPPRGLSVDLLIPISSVPVRTGSGTSTDAQRHAQMRTTRCYAPA